MHDNTDMKTHSPHYGYRFPPVIIAHAVWLYYRFSLSYREVQELLFERGITVSHEAIRGWCQKFGQDYANRLRRRRPQTGDKWLRDEVFLSIQGKRYYLWRAVDEDGDVLDISAGWRRSRPTSPGHPQAPLSACWPNASSNYRSNAQTDATWSSSLMKSASTPRET